MDAGGGEVGRRIKGLFLTRSVKRVWAVVGEWARERRRCAGWVGWLVIVSWDGGVEVWDRARPVDG